MCSESSSELHSSEQTGSQHNGGVSSRTPSSDGVDRLFMPSTSGHDDSGTHENSLLGFSSLRGQSSIKDSSSVPRRSRSPSVGDRNFSLGHSRLSQVVFHSLQASSFIPCFGPK